MNFKLIILSFSFGIGLIAIKANAQNHDSLTKQVKKKSFVISTNGIYNYFTHKTLITEYNPYGYAPNSKQKVYYWQYKYNDTYTFDLSLQYNRFLLKNFSWSAGIRFDQLKRIQKTLVYRDSSAYLPDRKKQTDTRYSFSAPMLGNFYLERFKFSFGLYAYFFEVSRAVYVFENGAENKFVNVSYGLQFLAHESIAFKLFKKKSLYLQVGLFHDFNFKNNYGYNKFFTLGLSFESARLYAFLYGS